MPAGRSIRFLKITTDEGIVGWSEYMDGYGAEGLTGGDLANGRDDGCGVEAVDAKLNGFHPRATGHGMMQNRALTERTPNQTAFAAPARRASLMMTEVGPGDM